MKRIAALLLCLCLADAVTALACTSVIVSGRARPDGRPVMFKHRDTRNLNNAIARFQGGKYAFIGLVNADWREKVGVKGDWPEVWAGVNEAGFCIMNTATYDFKDDDVPDSLMDREGLVMYRALEICSSMAEFEYYLDTLARPRGIEANFGVIDAYGGAAYFEVNNDRTVKFDVNADPEQWRVVTNFTQSGRKEDRKGVDRYDLTRAIMPEGESCGWDHSWLIANISRKGRPVLRDITASVVVFEGVPAGDDPSDAVMWACVGFPTAAPLVPLKVWDKDLTPAWLQALPTSEICDKALEMKEQDRVAQCLSVERLLDREFRPGISQRKYQRLMKRCYRLWAKLFK